MFNAVPVSANSGHTHQHRRLEAALNEVAMVESSSVTGLGWSIPLSLILSPGSLFCPGSALGRHLMGLDKEQVGQSNNAQWQGPAELSSA
jgi:hypothetical protein